ncbi:MAG TPA: acyl-CoA desaturase [Kofleriaceae bacterium]|jgi:stearoyl-CoA desaturase (delta-9 desaturase)|nr:acyl-CoA desaturase [Kofleriaceae bacterium]
MDPPVGRVRFAPVKSAWLWTMILTGAVGAVVATPRALAVAVVLHVITLCIGHSVGLHRGIIHRSYRASRIVLGVLAYLAVLTGLGGPLTWIRMHAVRDYWQNQPACPAYLGYRHSLARDFVWNLHCKFQTFDDRADARLPAGLFNDPWLRFLELTWSLHVLLLALVIAVVASPAAAATIVGTRTAAALLGHWFITYAAHRWGTQPHVTPGAAESGTNVWVLGVLSFGEGFHNHHHAFPRSARMGRAPHELDLGWLTVRAMCALGLARDVRS